MRKFIFILFFILAMAPLTHAVQVTIGTGGWVDLRGDINANFTELYGSWAALGTDYDTSPELAALFAGKQDTDADLTIYAGITPGANMQTLLGAVDFAAMRAFLDIEVGIDFYSMSAVDTAISDLQTDDLITLSGLAIGTTHLGIFTGSTITDNQTIKIALQELETALEALPGGHDALTLGTSNGLSLSTQQLSLAAATNTTPGAMTAAQVIALEAIDTELELEALLDHDNLIGFNINEHIDWTIDQGATNIHSGNIPDLTAIYQPYDVDLSDLADGSLSGSKVGFSDPNSDWTATDMTNAFAEMITSINGGTPNSAPAKVHWSQLSGVPAGFADGIDGTGTGGDQLVDIVTNSPLLVNGGSNVNDALPGSDSDIIFSISAATNTAPGHMTTAQVVALEAIDTESELEALLELQDLQGVITDAQVPDDITITALTLDGTPASNNSYDGVIISSLYAGEAIVQWKMVYFDSTDSEWKQADANVAGKWPCRAISVESGSDGTEMEVLTQGTIRNDGWNFSTPGASIYMSSDGNLTETAPTSAGSCVQIIGWVISPDEAYINISGHWMEVE